MEESDLNKSDRERISVDIKLTMLFGAILIIAIAIIIIGLIFFSFFFTGNEPAEGFAKRGLFGASLFTLFYVAITWKNLIKYADLRTGKKINFRTSDYEIKEEKDGLFLVTRSPLKLKLSVYEDLNNLIKHADPITIEISKWSKIRLYRA